MIIVEEIIKNQEIFEINLEKALLENLIATSNRCDTIDRKPQEPDFIAGLSLDFSKTLFKILDLLFPKLNFTVSGIYCHQKPFADYGSKPRPEIGDLLFVLIHQDSVGDKSINSLLFQAKVDDNPKIDLESDGSLHQLKLYLEWPKFKYYRAGNLTGIERDIIPKAISPGGRYMIIDGDLPYEWDPSFPEGSHIRCATPNKILIPDNDFVDELVDFFKFKSGRPIDSDPDSSPDHWTKLVWDMINLLKSKTSNRINSDLKNFPRITTNNLSGLLSFTGDTRSIVHSRYETLPEFHGDDIKGETEEGGVSLILIESFEEESEARL